MGSIKELSLKFRVTVRAKLIAAFSTIIIVIMLVTGVGIVALETVSVNYKKLYNEYTKGISYMGDAYGCIQMASIDVQQSYIYAAKMDVSDYITDFYNQLAVYEKSIGEFEKIAKSINDEKLSDMVKNLNADYAVFKSAGTQMMTCIEGGDTAGATAVAKQGSVSETMNDTLIMLKDIVSYIDSLADSQVQKDSASIVNRRTALTIVSILAYTYSIFCEVYIVKFIRKPVNMLKAAAKNLAAGDTNVNLIKYGNDEFSDLTDEFQEFVNGIQHQANMAAEVASGNLDIDVTVRGEEDVLGKALVELVRGNNETLLAIKEAIGQVSTGSDQVAGAAQSLAQGSTEQASAIQEITASIEEITGKTKKNASDANDANKLVITAKESAETGNSRMKDMRVAMNEINESSENISKIIKTIDDIAFQTNILALNAAVEAARAGVHGKGFAVVAEEVRSLAGKSAQAASETAELIEDSIQKVGRGSKLANETETALAAIMDEIDEIVALVSNIAASSNDQATAITQIDQALVQVSQAVQTNSATSQECAAASDQLSAQAARLSEMIAQYRLREGSISEPEEPADEKKKERIYSSMRNNPNEKIISLGEGFGKY